MEVDSKGNGYLVTGGAGFIGSHLCDALLKSGESVVCIDNMATGIRENVARLRENSCFSFIEGDVRSVDLEGLSVTRVYHLAALCGVPLVEHEPLEVMLTGIEGALRILRWAADRGVRVLYVSSSEIYGSGDMHPQSESYWGHANPVGPRSPYVEAKRAGEALCRAYRIKHGLSVRIARLFNVYGPGFRSDDPRVIPQFIKSAASGNPLIIYGTGQSSRSFCYVDDIVEGLIKLMNSEVEGPLNLGFPQEVEIGELANLVLRLTKSSSKINYLPAISEDPQRRLPDISRAKRLLGWNPKVTLEEGLKRTIISWFRGKE